MSAPPADEERRVPLPEVSDLIAPGQPLPFKVLDGLGRLLLAAGQVISDGRQLAALLERGACVVYEEAEAVRAARRGGAKAAGHASAVRRRTLFDRWEETLWALDALLRSLGRDPGQHLEIERFADAFISLVERDNDVALFLAVRQDDRRFALYSVAHALHTGVVVLLAARVLGWSPPHVRQAVLAALTMNVSIVDLQARMAEQPDPPTKKQIEQIRAHPTASVVLLRASGVTDAGWLTAVQDHHERADGGYPRGVAEIGELARLLRAADVFMAKISPRAGRPPQLPQLAARQLFQQEAGGPLAGAVIKAVGLYPPGDFVLLKNGEVGIVVHRAGAAPVPTVVALLDARGRPVPGAPRRDVSQAAFGIAGPVLDRAGLPRVLPEQVYGLLEP